MSDQTYKPLVRPNVATRRVQLYPNEDPNVPQPIEMLSGTKAGWLADQKKREMIASVLSGKVTVRAGEIITDKQRELFNLWLVSEYGEDVVNEEPIADEESSPLDNLYVADTHPSLLGIPQMMDANANRNPINERLLAMSPNDLSEHTRNLLMDKLKSAAPIQPEASVDDDEDFMEDFVEGFEYVVDGVTRYVPLDGKTQEEAIATLEAHIKLMHETPVLTDMSKQSNAEVKEILPVVEWTHVSESGITVARRQRELKPGDEGYDKINKVSTDAIIQALKDEAEKWHNRHTERNDSSTPE